MIDVATSNTRLLYIEFGFCDKVSDFLRRGVFFGYFACGLVVRLIM